ncbi:uncharacterized protein LOC111347676 [Stylophora pistillata]|uniref:uncharacterized protein LOC111347676 n=1 Tax=Stylophora pistillata TaxID=50429 RepID=UPI000C04D4FB|nr:uncharacterized protein LOC111347676 [Stylophora pistillata]
MTIPVIFAPENFLALNIAEGPATTPRDYRPLLSDHVREEVGFFLCGNRCVQLRIKKNHVRSQRTCITNELAEKLQLPITGSETLTVYTFSVSKPREFHTPITELRLLTTGGSSLHLRVNVVPTITGNLQRTYFNPQKFSHLLKDTPLADSVPSTTETANIELLLGNDYYCDIFSGDIAMKAVSPGINLTESKLGWILTGRVKCRDDKPDSSISMLTYTSSPISVHLCARSDDKQPLAAQKTQLEEFWKLETLGIREPVQENEDDKALQIFNETIHFEDGGYQVTWPWKEESPPLPTNYELAMGRLRSQVNRPSRNDKHLQK